VKVGRDAFDEEAIRLIEEKNPDVEFDWVRILKGPIQTDQKPAERSSESKRRGRDRNQQGRPPSRGTPHEETRSIDIPERDRDQEPAPPPEADRGAGVRVDVATEATNTETVVDELDVDAGLSDSDPAGVAEEVADYPGSPETAEAPAPSAAHRRLGSEGVSRLRARHAEVLARISERITDPVRKDELKATAERLNPDTWVTDDEVRAGLEQYETVFESLRGPLGRRRKRRRRGGRGGAERAASAEQLDNAATPPDSDDRVEEEDTDGDSDGGESNGS